MKMITAKIVVLVASLPMAPLGAAFAQTDADPFTDADRAFVDAAYREVLAMDEAELREFETYLSECEGDLLPDVARARCGKAIARYQARFERNRKIDEWMQTMARSLKTPSRSQSDTEVWIKFMQGFGESHTLRQGKARK